jgi:hypothetical protein
MSTHLPLPPNYYPRTVRDFDTISKRFGGQVSLRISTSKVEKTVTENGVATRKMVPAFVEWWVEYPAEFIPSTWPEPPAPSDPMVRDFLEAVAGVAARAWVKEAKVAKAWPEPGPTAWPESGGAPAPFMATPKRKGSK